MANMYKLWFLGGFAFVFFVCACMFLFVFVLTNNNTSSNVNRDKLVIDNDAGADDAMAIFIALLYEKHFKGPELIALTTGNGNTKEDNVCINNQKVLKVARRQDVPIYRGSKESLVSTSTFQVGYYGEDGLGDAGDGDANLIPAREENAVAMLIELSKKYKGHLTVVTTGALTNVALAMKLDNEFLDRLAHLYIAAGRIFNAETPEFNANMDIEAYHIVMKNAKSDKVTIIHNRAKINYTREWRETVLGKIDTDIMRAQNKYEAVSLNRTERWRFLDPAAVAVAIRPDLVKEYVYSKNDIVLNGEFRGLIRNIFVGKNDANIRAVHSIREDEYKQFLVDVFSSDKTRLA